MRFFLDFRGYQHDEESVVLCIHGFPTSNYDWSKVCSSSNNSGPSFLCLWGWGGQRREEGGGGDLEKGRGHRKKKKKHFKGTLRMGKSRKISVWTLNYLP